jgi:hypothetical protein
LTTLPPILGHYIPRLATIVFIEVFSFFFLRLYKTTLAESKFYQIQLLAFSPIDIALQAAMKSSDPSAMTAVIAQIASNRLGETVGSVAASKSGEIDVKGLADVLGRVAKIVVDASKGNV